MPWPQWNRYAGSMLLLLVALGGLIRALACLDEPWMDEIWSLRFAQHAHSALEIFTSPTLHHDNNHWLNTLWMYLLGEQSQWYPYRLLSLVAGVGTVLGLWIAGRTISASVGFLAAAMVSLSYLLVQYASEARGYAPAGFFAIFAFVAASTRISTGDRGQDTLPSPHSTALSRWSLNGLFWACCILGFCSHATFVYAFIGLSMWLPIAFYRAGRSLMAIIIESAGALLIPAAFAAWLYIVSIRGMTAGGGEDISLSTALSQAISACLGFAMNEMPAWISIAVALIGAVLGAWAMARWKCDAWIFFVAGGLMAPPLVLLMHHQQWLAPRHFYVAIVLLLPLWAAALAWMLAGRIWLKSLAAILLFAFAVGNASHLWKFLTVGRGHYRELAMYLVANTFGAQITVSSDHEARTRMVLGYYFEHVPLSGKTPKYIGYDSPTPPEWLLTHSQQIDPPEPKDLIGPWGAAYALEEKFPYYGLSGWHWFLYHRVR